MTITEKLAANEVFVGLEPGALERVRRAGEVVRIEPGDRLVDEGQINTHLYLVLEGAIEVRLLENPGRYSGVRLGVRKAGSCIGEYSLVDKKPASATAIASKSGELFKISYENLEKLLASQSDIGRTFYRNLLVHLVDRLRAANAELDLFRPL